MRVFLVVFCLLWALCGAFFLKLPAESLSLDLGAPSGDTHGNSRANAAYASPAPVAFEPGTTLTSGVDSHH